MSSRGTLVVLFLLASLLLSLVLLHLRSHPDTMPPVPPPATRLPEAVLFGVKKAGTEALRSILNSHPQLVVSALVNFYDKNFARGLEWYAAQLPRARPGQVLVDRTPAYFTAGPAIPQRIYRSRPGTLLLMVARDPIDRFVSDFLHWEGRMREEGRPLPFPSFSHFAFQTVDWPGGQVAVRNHSEVLSRLDRSCYARHLAHWLAVFPPNQILVVDGDQLRVAPWKEIARVQRFLGVKQLISERHFVKNPANGFYCWRLDGEQLKCLGDTKGRPHPELSAPEMELLKRHFTACNAQFRAQILQLPDPPTFQWTY